MDKYLHISNIFNTFAPIFTNTPFYGKEDSTNSRSGTGRIDGSL